MRATKSCAGIGLALRSIGLVALLAWPLATPARQSEAPPRAIDAPEEILVSGERPGPGLWRVSRGDHVLWILGTLSPVPREMTWRSREVEATIARADEVILHESVSVKLGLFSTLRHMRSLLRARFNPDGATLADVVPADLYTRWSVLQKQYLAKDGEVSKLRPMFAATTLFARALERTGLTEKDEVLASVRTLAKRHKVTVTSPAAQLSVKDPKSILQEFSHTPPQNELACFASVLGRLETDIEGMRQRANAWAVGDIETLQRLRPSSDEDLCIAAFTSAPGIKEEFARLTQQAREAWLQNVERALERHKETLAVVPIGELLAPDGRLAQLQALGYSVESPGR
jgi:uncharacterized protein YbaP (TraB family)